MPLSKAEIEERLNYANASEAGIITGDDIDKVLRLWNEKRREIEPEDLSKVIPVQIGSLTEPFNLELAGDKIGVPVESQQKVVYGGDKYPWLRATLDGVVNGCPVEAKHVRAFHPHEELTPRFNAQVQQQMLLLNAPKAYLSVIIGTFEHILIEIEADPIFQSQLIDATKRFMDCVKSGEPPVAVGIKTPVIPVRKVDMSSSNSWNEHANVWLKNRGYAKAFDLSVKELKALIEPDVVEAFGAGIVAKRAKNGNVSIREAK